MQGNSGNLVMRALDWVLLLILSVLWGASFFFFKVLVAEAPPLTVVLGRVGLAALLLHALLLARREFLPRDPPLWAALGIMALLNNVIPFTLIAYGETRISSGLASLLNATTPIFTVLAAQVLTTDEKLNGARLTGVLFGFLGVLVLVGPAAVGHWQPGGAIGEVACLAAASSYALAGIFGRHFRGIAPLKIAAGQVTASTVILLPVAALVDAPWALPAPSAQFWLALVGLASLSTALAYVIYFRLLAVAGATNLVLVTFLLPLSAMVLGALFLHETITRQALVGMGLIGLGLVAIDGRAWRALSSERATRES